MESTTSEEFPTTRCLKGEQNRMQTGAAVAYRLSYLAGHCGSESPQPPLCPCKVLNPKRLALMKLIDKYKSLWIKVSTKCIKANVNAYL